MSSCLGTVTQHRDFPIWENGHTTGRLGNLTENLMVKTTKKTQIVHVTLHKLRSIEISTGRIEEISEMTT